MIAEDLTGREFVRLTVLGPSQKKGRDSYWNCRCACGSIVVSTRHRLTSGNTRSCGCLKREMISKRRRKHGATVGGRTPEYEAWKSMIQRCTNPQRTEFEHYGGRGIKVCAQWQHSFETFLRDVGQRPSAQHSLDRFPDVNGGYEPGNVRWATKVQQMRNMRTNRLLTHSGKTQTMADWAEETGLPASVIWKRLYRNWSVEKALTTPVRRSAIASPEAL